MDIHFCDLCNESVPQSDLDAGRAFRRKGRVICARCERAMGGLEREEEPAAPPHPGAAAVAAPASAVPETRASAAHPPASARAAVEEAGGGAVPTALAALAVLVTAAVAVLLFDRIERGESLRDADLARLRDDVSQGLQLVRGDLSEARAADGAALSTLTAELAEVRASHEESARASREAAEAATAALGSLGERLAVLEGLAAEVERHERDIGALVDEYSKLRQDLALVADHLAALEERAPAAAPAQPTADAAAAQPEGPEWTAHLGALASPSPGDRWEAVQRLGETGDPDVVPYLLPLLHDPDTFVRMASARVLGDLGALEAVAALIDALEDDEPTVRETAYLSLRALTDPVRQDPLPFDPDGSDAERAKRVKAWREWWKKEAESLLAEQERT